MSSSAVGGDVEIPGVHFSRLQPGGLSGPNGEVHIEVPGGAVWQDMWMIGTDDDGFKMTIPDIRMPANQLWPLHWHDEWIAVVGLDGLCTVGDTPLARGGVLISRENVEYGPVLSGPRGSQILEVFARTSFGGGYAAEYHDHPTLQNLAQRAFFGATSALPPADGGTIVFGERPAGSERNAGNQVMPNEGADGIWLGQLGPGAQKWNLGEPDDPTTRRHARHQARAGSRYFLRIITTTLGGSSSSKAR